MSSEKTPGRSLVTRRAIVDVVRAATLGSYGVAGVAGGPVGRLLARFDLAHPGITVRIAGGVDIDLDLVVALGVPVAEVARQVDSAVRYALRHTLGVDVRELHIHIDGVRVQPGGAPPIVVETDPGADPASRPRRERDGRGLMPRRSCDGPGLLEAFRAATANLEAHVDEINNLNVYPVPDGDTGSNMAATVRAALEEAEGVAGGSVERVAAAISFGALMGARGNSGVITSQIFRGMADGLAGKRRFNGLDLAHALAEGARTAYAAVAKPVEGTILTVIRESADAAVAAAAHSEDIETVLAATVDAAEKSVARTPTLLAILREAGVVDSGGQGLYRLFQGALLHLVGQTLPTEAHDRTPSGPKPSTLVAHADEGFGYETMFLLQATGATPLDVDAIRRHLEIIGESVLVAGDGRALKIHVHNEQPDLVIGYGLTQGTLSRISVENLDNQARDVREAKAAEFTTESGGHGASAHAKASAAGGVGITLPLGVVAVVSGDGLAAIFHDFGVAAVVQGGQTANPSTGELLDAIGRVDAREILILPNNPNVILAARQVASMTDRPVVVVPTRNAAEGFAALLALDPTLDASANAEPMTDAAPGGPDDRGHRGGARCDDRWPQGQTRSDDRAGPRRWAGGGRRGSRDRGGGRGQDPQARLRVDHRVLWRWSGPGGGRGDGPSDRRDASGDGRRGSAWWPALLPISDRRGIACPAPPGRPTRPVRRARRPRSRRRPRTPWNSSRRRWRDPV